MLLSVFRRLEKMGMNVLFRTFYLYLMEGTLKKKLSTRHPSFQMALVI